jgi:hypothetical protein
MINPRNRVGPKEFFIQFVTRSYQEWAEKPGDYYLAKVATHHFSVMAERVWHEYKDRHPEKVFNASSANEYFKKLAERCADFGLVRDVADGFKHVTLSRSDRRVTSKDQTEIANGEQFPICRLPKRQSFQWN